VRSIFPLAFVLATLATSGSVQADPVLECRVLAGDDIALRDCLRTQLDISYRAMVQAQELARGTARGIDDQTGREIALRGVEASQHAWEAYRDVECKTLAVFVAGGVPAETAQFACEIRLTRERTDVLLRFAREGR
jgi:uncharacterized protein YecT (DUF1311 family)